MKLYTFKRESNDFNDILKDKEMKSAIVTKISWKDHLMIQFKSNVNDSTLGYMMLKYGENIINPVERDYTPRPNIDYIPKR